MLTERDKETLRLLLRGHDAKSIAQIQELSVHTVNERLRDARKKLGVSSSREAARLLAASEDIAPNIVGGQEIEVMRAATIRQGGAQRERSDNHRFLWISGGMLDHVDTYSRWCTRVDRAEERECPAGSPCSRLCPGAIARSVLFREPEGCAGLGEPS
ncbi:helix-turn-helix domain-containing protein [Novosphingobium sp. JCM 18896]|uniref:helix-turn-helix domain-containing protein n=1 Tax=Novosphingobium sp. JCM 18896 TaxID=2989731 RepID=UPI0039B5A906